MLPGMVGQWEYDGLGLWNGPCRLQSPKGHSGGGVARPQDSCQLTSC